MAKTRYPPKPRPKTRAEFNQREQSVWDEMTSTWAGLAASALLQPGACGPTWGIKDVMNHIAAWQEITLQALPDLLQGKHVPYPGVEHFNAKHQAEDKDLSLEDTVRRFEQTRQRLLGVIATLPDDQLLDPKTKIGYWIKYATYGHYSGHIYNLREFRKQFE
jgi:hypothetical protein